jgi:hypothetical protein
VSPGIIKIVAKDRASELRPFFAMGDDFLDIVDSELADAAEQIKDIAELTAPYDADRKYGTYVNGHLKDAHYIKRLKRFVYQVANDTYYAYWVHDGTRKMEPRPWLKNAHDEVVDGVLRRITMKFKYGGSRKMSIAEAEEELFG